MKQKSLWESLSGEFVLTMQIDTWITNDCGFNINDFIKLNKSFIGGNMTYVWEEFSQREGIQLQYNNFNGGLSLRKRMDMIKVIENFPPKKTNAYGNKDFYTDGEDVYFTLGCYKLGLPIGDDEESSYFTIHTVFKKKFWGIHNTSKKIIEEIQLEYPNIYFSPYILNSNINNDSIL
jgi:hypothetical protein